MRFKVEVSFDREDLANLYIEQLRLDLNYIRLNYKICGSWHKKFFPNTDEIPLEHQWAFAKLLDKVGYKNKHIRKYKDLKTKYLKEVNQAWKDYYISVSHGLLPTPIRYEYREWENNLFKVGQVDGLISEYLRLAGKHIKIKRLSANEKEIVKMISESNLSGFMEVVSETLKKDYCYHLSTFIYSLKTYNHP
jgi:homospermidine synthase